MSELEAELARRLAEETARFATLEHDWNLARDDQLRYRAALERLIGATDYEPDDSEFAGLVCDIARDALGSELADGPTMSDHDAEIASLRAQLADAIRQRDSYHQGLFQVHALLADRTAQFTRPQLGEMCRAALAAGER